MELSWFYGSEQRADVELVLREEAGDDAADDDADQAEAAAAGSKRARGGCSSGGEQQEEQQEQQEHQEQQQEEVLPAHAMVLIGSSGFCKAKLESWADGEARDDAGRDQQEQQQQPAAKRHCGGGQQAAAAAAALARAAPATTISRRARVVLHVPRGQLAVGRRLVRAMYEAKPALGDLGAEQLVQLLLLADRYDAPRIAKKAAKAAAAAVSCLEGGELDWGVVRAVFALPDACAALPACAPLLAAAAKELQRQLGDLELVWAGATSEQKRQRLLELPFGAIKVLLASDETRIASENTAFHTVQRWLDVQRVPAADARAKELLGLLRVARMTPHYARTVFCESALAKAHLDSDGLKLAGTLPLVDVSKTKFDSAYISKHPSWLEPARPRSALAGEVMVEWRLPLAELQRCVEQQLAAGEGSSPLLRGPEDVVWQGWPLQLCVRCILSAGGGLTLDLYLHVKQPCSEAVVVVTYTLKAAAANGSGISTIASTYAFTQLFGYGRRDFFDLDEVGGATPPRDWASLEAALRGKGVVHGSSGAGGGEAAAHLKLRARVTRLE